MRIDLVPAIEHVNACNERQSNHQVTDSVFLLEGLSFFFCHPVTSLLRGLPHGFGLRLWSRHLCWLSHFCMERKTAIKMRRQASGRTLNPVQRSQSQRFNHQTDGPNTALQRPSRSDRSLHWCRAVVNDWKLTN
ncbi:hypothetical [Parasynechococcus marenigrum WH 8102]|uniref:Uncharacterized protein n=1 Tax=Parasynechococcus marenigrum (strain WH8102) TaxID=84588 RepID=Q7U5Y1_PARMW|nr:hypothetical [Parasynechococcus marenigrum WH 8102]